MNARYLTKSRFKLAMECPTKLYYTGKPEYANQTLEDSFLEELANGGFQVGQLAKLYYPGGYEIETLDIEEALRQTNELLKKEEVVIYEAAIRFQNLLVRVDILRKSKTNIELVEVKAKSVDPTNTKFQTKNGIVPGWCPYLFDTAYQKYVFKSSFPEYDVRAFLMLVNKVAVCATNGLNQKFRVVEGNNGRKQVIVSPSILEEDLAEPILVKINVDGCCDSVYLQKYGPQDNTFEEYIKKLAEIYDKDVRVMSNISKACAKCEFKATEREKSFGLKSGFEECWKAQLNWKDADFLEGTVFDIWAFRNKDKLINEGRIKLSELVEDDIMPQSDDQDGISPSQRQWMQVQKAQSRDHSYWIDSEKLRKIMNTWVYPLHFIDFETAMVAIPFNKRRRPYEGIAFQFSHHIVHQHGQIEHRGQYLNAKPGNFPNYDFIRKLKDELNQDEGSIFCYADHENTYLNMIYEQLMEEQQPIPDREELCSFIKSITHSKYDQWIGPRNMVDMRKLVLRYYYDPAMKGSNSIKQVLPAILNSSRFLQEKYSKQIYGADGGILSLNFKNWKWIEFDNERVVDPYKLLPKIFKDESEKDNEILSESDEINNGGAALTAYAKMQFEEMSDYERTEISNALLKYCELDTLAMVMIYEAWKDMIEHS